MPETPLPPRKHGLTAIDGALALIALLLIVQMWLLTATLESYLAGHHEVVLPATLISGAFFLISGGLYLFVIRIDIEARQNRPEKPPPGTPETDISKTGP